MARSHVPRFGDWDSDNLPYTTYFENARKEKAGIRMNPNDPEENPEAFMCMRGGLEGNCHSQPVQVPLVVNSSKSTSADKHHIDGQSRQNTPNRSGSYDYQKTARSQSARSHRRMAAESGSENSYSDHSFLQSNHRSHTNSGQKKGRSGGSSFSASVSGHSRKGSGSYKVAGNEHHRTASIPKFGEWDETDPTSGEGYTAIFNKVKEEKQTPSNFPNVPPQPSNYSDHHHQRRRPSSSFYSKMCCWLFSRGSD
ncbi:RPM1-interacting protein 4-like isoform X2 [Durio zibethinus]|uniref:RPM1-interacting protein 4-like isoform X2 n=1 Tax=Durio zibethinus TaxID=66656 RepID=A0A6P5X6E2_DURZI|nr:RPM1-interacting protein 4-like isoform X2 [Durio zibethinus]